jgi:hypothetical protein
MSARANARSATKERSKMPAKARTERWITTVRDGFYKVADRSLLQFGKSYSDWVCDWFNWFISMDADSRNSGPVVFLRSYGMPDISGIDR